MFTFFCRNLDISRMRSGMTLGGTVLFIEQQHRLVNVGLKQMCFFRIVAQQASRSDSTSQPRGRHTQYYCYSPQEWSTNKDQKCLSCSGWYHCARVLHSAKTEPWCMAGLKINSTIQKEHCYSLFKTMWINRRLLGECFEGGRWMFADKQTPA